MHPMHPHIPVPLAGWFPYDQQAGGDGWLGVPWQMEQRPARRSYARPGWKNHRVDLGTAAEVSCCFWWRQLGLLSDVQLYVIATSGWVINMTEDNSL